MTIPRVGIEIDATTIKAIWLTPQCEQKSIETIPLPVERKDSGTTLVPSLTWERLQSIPDRFSFRGAWEAALAAEPLSFLLWDGRTGEVLTPLLSWRDNHGQKWFEQLTNEDKHLIKEMAGINISPGQPLARFNNFLSLDSCQKALEAGQLCWGNIGTWILWRATGGELHWMDHSQAQYSGLYSPVENNWSSQLLERFNVPPEILPEVGKTLKTRVSVRKLWKKCNLVGIVSNRQSYVIGNQPPESRRGVMRLATDAEVSLPESWSDNADSESGDNISLPAASGARDYISGRIPAAGSAVNWFSKIFSLDRQVLGQWIKPPWPQSPPLWSLSFYGTGAPHNSAAPAVLTNFQETSSTRELAQGLLLSLLLQLKQMLGDMLGKHSGEVPLTFGGGLARLPRYPSLAASVLNNSLAVNLLPLPAARGAVIHSHWQHKYLQRDPWRQTNLSVVLPEDDLPVNKWEQLWRKFDQRFFRPDYSD